MTWAPPLWLQSPTIGEGKRSVHPNPSKHQIRGSKSPSAPNSGGSSSPVRSVGDQVLPRLPELPPTPP